MKKLIAVLAVLIGLLLVAGFVYVLVFMEEPPDSILVDSPNSQGDGQPKLNDPKEVVTQADELDALDSATQRNQDTVGWLKVPGTTINNCVLQSYDNSVYLRTNEAREYDVYGCYFADWECSLGSREILSDNIIIYGHSDLKDNAEGPRFSQLFHFTDPAFAEATPVISFSTLENFMDWEVFAVFYTEKSFNYIDAYPEEGVDQLAKEAQEKSLYDYGITVGPEDKILTLSTCTIKYGAEDNDHRFVVMARLLPEGAEAPATAKLTVRTPAE